MVEVLTRAGEDLGREASVIEFELSPEDAAAEMGAAIAARSAIVLDFDPIAAAVGPARWRRHGGLLPARTVSLLEADPPEQLICRPLGPAALLVLMPLTEREDALVRCLAALRGAMRELMGSSMKILDCLFEATGFDGGVLRACGAKADELRRLENRRDVLRRAAAERARAREPFITSDGRAIRVAASLERFVNLETDSTIGARIRVHVISCKDDAPLPREVRVNLAGVDQQRIDWAGLVNGLERLEEDGHRPSSLIVPASYATLTSHRARTQMLELLDEARVYAVYGLIAEVGGIDGAPLAPLQEAIAFVKPHVLLTVGRVDLKVRGSWRHLRSAGFHGLAFDCPTGRPESVLRRARLASSKARQACSSLLVYGLVHPGLCEDLVELGISHATLPGP